MISVNDFNGYELKQILVSDGKCKRLEVRVSPTKSNSIMFVITYKHEQLNSCKELFYFTDFQLMNTIN